MTTISIELTEHNATVLEAAQAFIRNMTDAELAATIDMAAGEKCDEAMIDFAFAMLLAEAIRREKDA